MHRGNLSQDLNPGQKNGVSFSPTTRPPSADLELPLSLLCRDRIQFATAQPISPLRIASVAHSLFSPTRRRLLSASLSLCDTTDEPTLDPILKPPQPKMDDKKNEDYVVRMPDERFGDKDAFMPRVSPSRRSHNVTPVSIPQSISRLDSNPSISVAAYCLSSISMTVVNKYVVSGSYWNLTLFYLAVQVRCRARTVSCAPANIGCTGRRVHCRHHRR